MSNVLTREKKRKIQEKDKGIVDFVKMQNHMFPDLIKRLGSVQDPRHQSYTIYDTDTLLYLVILKNIFSLHTMRGMNDWFYDGNCHENLEKLTGSEIPDIPHYDTINDFLEVLSPYELDEIRVEMVRQLIRSKNFYPARLPGGQWLLIMDGTGLHHFEERHCENCLVREITDKEGKKKRVYSHHVLEAKLVLADNIVISLGTEFIENESEYIEELTGKDFVANIYEYVYVKKIKGRDTQVRFQWLTDIELNNRNIEEMVRSGRKRWKIENEGFNNQKNGIYRIEHLNSHNPNAMKNHYLLTQISDIIMQLYLAGNKILKVLKQAIKNTSSRLLETFRRDTVSDEDVEYIIKYTTVHFT